MMVTAGTLFAVAKDAYDRACSHAGDPRTHVSHEPLVAIVFSAAAGEAFLNEIVDLAEQQSLFIPQAGPEPREVVDLVALLTEAERSRATVGLKLLIGKLALSGSTYDRGGLPFQDFATLMSLRNALLHLKSESIGENETGDLSVEHPSVIERLRAKNVLAKVDDENALASWIHLVSTPAVAKWACNATANIVCDLRGSTPEGELRSKMDQSYFQFGGFAPIE